MDDFRDFMVAALVTGCRHEAVRLALAWAEPNHLPINYASFNVMGCRARTHRDDACYPERLLKTVWNVSKIGCCNKFHIECTFFYC